MLLKYACLWFGAQSRFLFAGPGREDKMPFRKSGARTTVVVALMLGCWVLDNPEVASGNGDPSNVAYDFEDRVARVTINTAPTDLTVGWEFRPNVPIQVTHLGYFDAGNTSPQGPPDGLLSTHPLGIWRADGTMLFGSTVSNGTVSAEFQSFRYIPLPPPGLRLEANQNYVVAALTPQGSYANSSFDPYPNFAVDWTFPLPGGGFEIRQPVVDYSAAITFIRSRQRADVFLRFPTTTIDDDRLVGAVNFRFQIVPEPNAIVLLTTLILVICVRPHVFPQYPLSSTLHPR
jgi:hypothetical protein